jgi:hypothetical protein
MFDLTWIARLTKSKEAVIAIAVCASKFEDRALKLVEKLKGMCDASFSEESAQTIITAADRISSAKNAGEAVKIADMLFHYTSAHLPFPEEK